MYKILNFVKQAGEFVLADVTDANTGDDGIIVPCVDPRKAAAFERYRPVFYDQSHGCVQAELHAIVVDDGTFETVAYYDVMVPEGSSRVRLTTYRSEIVDGVMARVHEYATVIVPTADIAHRHRPRWRLMLAR
jgi:hypothetical protein